MIDIHSHILPGLDDGAQDIFDTLEMVDMAAKNGVRTIIATPHCNMPGGIISYSEEEYRERIQVVKAALWQEGIPVNILPGAEALATPELPELIKEGKIMTLNNSRYLLTEFMFDEDPELANKILDEIREMQLIPVIAHPERYKFVQRDLNVVYEWRMKGYPTQINKGSVRGKFGTQVMETAFTLLDHNLVSIVASDAHRPKIRTTNMTKAYQELWKCYPEQYVEILFHENPRRICQNEPLLALKAIQVE